MGYRGIEEIEGDSQASNRSCEIQIVLPLRTKTVSNPFPLVITSTFPPGRLTSTFWERSIQWRTMFCVTLGKYFGTSFTL
jgi:hypothetical protein